MPTITSRNLASNPVKFSANRATTQSLTGGSNTTLVFTAKDFDTGNNFNTTTGQFTAPSTGFYQFSTSVAIVASSSAVMYVSLYKNGTEIKRGDRTVSATQVDLTLSCTIQLAAADVIDIRPFTQTTFSTEANAISNYFDGFLVSYT